MLEINDDLFYNFLHIFEYEDMSNKLSKYMKDSLSIIQILQKYNNVKIKYNVAFQRAVHNNAFFSDEDFMYLNHNSKLIPINFSILKNDIIITISDISLYFTGENKFNKLVKFSKGLKIYLYYISYLYENIKCKKDILGTKNLQRIHELVKKHIDKT